MFGRRPAVIGQGRRQDATVQGLNFLRRSWARLAFGLLLGLVLGVGSTLWATAQELPPGQQLIPNPQQFRALEQPNNALSVLRAEQLAAEADAAIQAQYPTDASTEAGAPVSKAPTYPVQAVPTFNIRLQ